MTNDPMALGIVLALEGIPRAVFMLLGGAITDRISPRLVMLITNVTRFFLTAMMATLVYLGIARMWMIYGFGLAFGVVAGFAIPAENSIVPMLVKEDDLQAGNSLMMGVTQLAGFIGPTIAGILIGGFSSSNMGIVLSFVIDALTFIVSAVSLWLIRAGKMLNPSSQESVWSSILTGIKYLWDDRALRLIFLVLMAVNFLIMGPLLVGIPVLANQRLPEGAVAYGLLLSAFAGGNLIGILTAGSLSRPGSFTMKVIMISFFAAFGLVVGALGFIRYTWVDFGLLLLLGLGNGYLAIILFTWMQTRTPKDMLGRMMSLITFSSTGLVPISQAVSGAVSKWNLTLLFTFSGGLVLLVTLWMTFHPDLKVFSASLIEAPAEAFEQSSSSIL
jgi:MFS family permease